MLPLPQEVIGVAGHDTHESRPFIVHMDHNYFDTQQAASTRIHHNLRARVYRHLKRSFYQHAALIRSYRIYPCNAGRSVSFPLIQPASGCNGLSLSVGEPLLVHLAPQGCWGRTLNNLDVSTVKLLNSGYITVTPDRDIEPALTDADSA